MLNNKTILITGGTGTVGKALIMHIMQNYSVKVIRIYSRDESKQHQIQNQFKEYNDKLRFLIGNIRDINRLNRAMENVDIVFHLAALKHVFACENNPFEAVKTNIIGVQNVIDVSLANNVEKVLFTSTDKAATPSNTMGVTKLLGEKLMTTTKLYKGNRKTIFCSVRFGNVLGSRGSLIPIIEHQVKNDSSITLTHKEMTRYIMSIDNAVRFILDALKIAQGGEVFVLKMNVIKIIDLVNILIEYYSQKHNKVSEHTQIKEIGIFAGEKLYEELFSIEEATRTYEIDDMYIIVPQLSDIRSSIDLNKYNNIRKFNIELSFNSKDGAFLTKTELKEYLVKNNII